MLKIDVLTDADGTRRVVLSGRIDGDQLAELQRVIEGQVAGTGTTLDLGDVRLVAREGIDLLARCEARGIRLSRCPAYVREWIDRLR